MSENSNFGANLENNLSSDEGPAEAESQEQEVQEQESSQESESQSAEQSSGQSSDQPEGATDLREATDIKENKQEKGEPKTYTVKVDGEEMKVTEDELLRGYQLRKASDKRFQEGMQARKQAEEFIRLLKTDPEKVLSHPSIGLDLKNFAEEYLMKDLQNEMMTPEQKQLKEYKEKLAKYEEEEKKKQEDEKKKQEEEVRKKYADNYHKQIVGALENSGLPKTEYTVQRMVHYMHNALENGYELGADDVTDLVKRDYVQDIKSLSSGLDADALVNILGEDTAKKLRQAELDKLKKPQNNLEEPAKVKRGNKKKKKKSNKMTKDQWRDYINSIDD